MVITPYKTGRLMRVLPLAALALAFAVMGSGRASASILQLDVLQVDMAVDLDDVLAGVFDEPSSSSSSPASGCIPAPARLFDPPAPTEGDHGYASNLQPSGTMGTSSSSGPVLGGNGAAQSFVMSDTVSVDENPFVLRLAERQNFFLLPPLCLDLLRPPQFEVVGTLQVSVQDRSNVL